MTFKVIDYHKGDTKTALTITTLNQLKKYAEKNGYKAVWPEFNNMILWVTQYNRFTQR